MGAYSFLARKVGRRLTEELVTSGNMYSGRQLYDMGVVDVLAPDGAGEAAVYSFIRKHAKTPNGRRAVEMARREIEPVTLEELMRVVRHLGRRCASLDRTRSSADGTLGTCAGPDL